MPQIRLWACAAACADASTREVSALYWEGKPLLVGRPWITPVSPTAIQIDLGESYSLLATIISVSDYYVHEGVWFGQIAAPWQALAAVYGGTRHRLYLHLNKLADRGYIHYNKAASRHLPPLIKVFPRNAKTSDWVLGVEPSWLRHFVLSVEPRQPLYDVGFSKAREPIFTRIVPAEPSAKVSDAVASSPVMISREAHRGTMRPSKMHSEGNLEIIRQIDGIWEAKDEINIQLGRDPGEEEPTGAHSAPVKSATGADSAPVDDQSDPDIMPSRWSQGGINVEIRDRERDPQEGDIGTGAISSRYRHCDRDLRGCGDRESIDGSAATGGSGAASGSAAPAAPAAPQASAPPAAALMYVQPRSERQLQPRTLATIHEQRGRRLSNKARLSLSRVQVSCIETYERLSGVPFCVGDLEHLDRALAMTSHALVLKSIESCSLRWPKGNPGYYLIIHGMSQVARHIEMSKHLRLVQKVKKAPKPPKGEKASGYSPRLNKLIRSRHLNGGKAEAVAPTPTPTPTAEGDPR